MILRRDVEVIARVPVVAVLAYFSAEHRAPLLSVALVTALAAWPISVVLPMRWRGDLEQSDAVRYGMLFLSASVGIFVIAFGDARDASFPSTALLMGFATVHMAGVWLYLRPQPEDLWRVPTWMVGAMLFIAGVMGDLPASVGWNALTFGLYGVTSGAALHRIQMTAAETSREHPGRAV